MSVCGYSRTLSGLPLWPDVGGALDEQPLSTRPGPRYCIWQKQCV